jgi:hypothetical protein
MAELIVGRLSPGSAHSLLYALCGGDDPMFFNTSPERDFSDAYYREDAPRLADVARTLLPIDLHPIAAPLAAKACGS